MRKTRRAIGMQQTAAADHVLNARVRLRKLLVVLVQYSGLPLVGALVRVLWDLQEDLNGASRVLESLTSGGRRPAAA